MPGSAPRRPLLSQEHPLSCSLAGSVLSPLVVITFSLTALQAWTVPGVRGGRCLQRRCFAQGYCFLGPGSPGSRPCDFGLHVRSVRAVSQGLLLGVFVAWVLTPTLGVRGVWQLSVPWKKHWLLWSLSTAGSATARPRGEVTGPSPCLQRLLETGFVPFAELLPPLGRRRWKLNNRNFP